MVVRISRTKSGMISRYTFFSWIGQIRNIQYPSVKKTVKMHVCIRLMLKPLTHGPSSGTHRIIASLSTRIGKYLGKATSCGGALS